MVAPELKRREDESLREYVWRVGQAHADGELDMTWTELAEVMNKECDNDWGESAYRKKYSEGLAWWDEVFSGMTSGDALSAMRDERHTIIKERVKLRDERAELNRLLRNDARKETQLDILREQIAKAGEKKFPYHPTIINAESSSSEMIVCLSDWHLGAEFDGFNSDIAYSRVVQYLYEIKSIANRYNVQSCTVVLLGDLINGGIHPTLRISNRENVVEQTMLAGEMIANFLHMLSETFSSINIAHVSGNHSRVTANKEESLLHERLDDVVAWYAQGALSHCTKIHWTNCKIPSDTYSEFEVCGKKYVAIHGDFDVCTENGIAKLITWLGYKPYAVLCGHKHTSGMMDVAKIQIIQSGCLCGSGDDYTTQNRLSCDPSQTVLVCDSNGIYGIYPIRLK